MTVWKGIKKVFIIMGIAIFILIILSLLPIHLLERTEEIQDQSTTFLLADEIKTPSKTYWNTQIILILSNVELELVSIQSILTQDSVNLIDFYMSISEETAEDLIGILTLEVPIESMDDFLSNLQSIGKIDSIQTYTNNEVLLSQDTESWIENLTIQEKRYQELMKEHTDLNDIISIEKELARIHVELDNWNVLKQQSEQSHQMNTIKLQIKQLVPEESWKELIQKEVLFQCNQISMVFKSIVTKLIGLVPYMLIGVVMILIGWVIFKQYKR